MNNKNIVLFVRSILALFLAIQVWVWLRYAGAFWLSDSLGFMKEIRQSSQNLVGSLSNSRRSGACG